MALPTPWLLLSDRKLILYFTLPHRFTFPHALKGLSWGEADVSIETPSRLWFAARSSLLTYLCCPCWISSAPSGCSIEQGLFVCLVSNTKLTFHISSSSCILFQKPTHWNWIWIWMWSCCQNVFFFSVANSFRSCLHTVVQRISLPGVGTKTYQNFKSCGNYVNRAAKTLLEPARGSLGRCLLSRNQRISQTGSQGTFGAPVGTWHRVKMWWPSGKSLRIRS